MAATEIVSGVSGESEQKLRELFEQAMVSRLMTLMSHCQIVEGRVGHPIFSDAGVC